MRIFLVVLLAIFISVPSLIFAMHFRNPGLSFIFQDPPKSHRFEWFEQQRFPTDKEFRKELEEEGLSQEAIEILIEGRKVFAEANRRAEGIEKYAIDELARCRLESRKIKKELERLRKEVKEKCPDCVIGR